MPVPSAVIRVPICSDDSILSLRARSTFKILPRSGRTGAGTRGCGPAWRCRRRCRPRREQLGFGRNRALAIGSLPGSEVMPTRSCASFRALSRGFGGRAAAWITCRRWSWLRSGALEPGIEHVVMMPSTAGRTSEETQLCPWSGTRISGPPPDGKPAVKPSRQVVAGQRDLLLARGRRRNSACR